jgi:hypothetical protein
MTRDESQFDPEDKLNETESPAPDAGPPEDDPAPAGDTADHPPSMSALDYPVELVGDEPPADVSALPPVPTDVSEWAAELFAGPSVTPPLTDPSPSSAAQKDGSTTVSAAGDADPATTNLPPGNVASPGSYEQLRIAHGLGNFRPESSDVDAPPTPPLLFDPVLLGDGGQPPRPRNPGSSSASPSVSVEVRVDFTPAGLARLAQEYTRAGAEFSRKEIGIVAGRLDELEEETRIRETNHRTVD